MIVAIQQPEHLPWIGFFNKMSQCDLFVYLDNVQFKKRYFDNRNKIKTLSGVKWITVAVNSKGRYTQAINQVNICVESKWKGKYLSAIESAYNSSPFWLEVKNIVYTCIDSDVPRLVDLNLMLIEMCRKYLNILTPTILASSLGPLNVRGSDLILAICKKNGANTYISGPDGSTYLKIDDFQQNAINLVYHHFEHPEYSQQFGAFMSHMSIIDLIANCGPKSEAIVKNCYKIDFKNGY